MLLLLLLPAFSTPLLALSLLTLARMGLLVLAALAALVIGRVATLLLANIARLVVRIAGLLLIGHPYSPVSNRAF